ncbi:MAG: hypothetical protein HOV96_19635 [Nonomuraea sp.]|nr:hypothetical protein [Nonomuraea sp.]
MTAPFANSYTAPVQEFGEDQLGAGMFRSIFRDIWARVQGRAGQAYYGGFEGSPENTLGGYGNSPQSFIGVAGRGRSDSITTNGAYPTIASGIVEGPMGDPVRRIFADRLRRGAM